MGRFMLALKLIQVMKHLMLKIGIKLVLLANVPIGWKIIVRLL
jgi:hypothetical protein